jgi:cell division septation protein DedD
MSDDTEITLGTGRVLLLFFALVGICGLCFGFGFRLGRSTATADIAADATSTPATANTAPKNTASKRGNTPPPDANPSGTSPEQLTFYKSVEQKEDNPQLSPAASTAPAAPAPETQPASSKPPEALPISGYVVQVAAVTKAEDAEALVSALKKKQYAVFTATNPPNDRLYHVQVGPFADVKEAEAVRSKLVSDGYNPILKR